MKSIRKGRLLADMLFPLAVGMISAALSYKGMADYASMSKPLLSPPSWVFSVAWTALYLMMGAAFYAVMESGREVGRGTALFFYLLQLFINFMWSILFFVWKKYLLSFFWLLLLLAAVILCTIRFYRMKKITIILMAPYVLWLIFAAYLNFGTYLLSTS